MYIKGFVQNLERASPVKAEIVSIGFQFQYVGGAPLLAEIVVLHPDGRRMELTFRPDELVRLKELAIDFEERVAVGRALKSQLVESEELTRKPPMRKEPKQ